MVNVEDYYICPSCGEKGNKTFSLTIGYKGEEYDIEVCPNCRTEISKSDWINP